MKKLNSLRTFIVSGTLVFQSAGAAVGDVNLSFDPDSGVNGTGRTVAMQSTTNLNSPAGWSTVSQVPVIVNGQHTVTNPVSGPREFYPLIQ